MTDICFPCHCEKIVSLTDTQYIELDLIYEMKLYATNFQIVNSSIARGIMTEMISHKKFNRGYLLFHGLTLLSLHEATAIDVLD